MGKWDLITNEQIIECAKKGLSVRESSEELGVPFCSFRKIINNRKLTKILNDVKKDFKDEKKIIQGNTVINLYLSGVPIEKITNILNMDIYKVIKELNKGIQDKSIKAAICENCQGINNYTYGSGRFCSKECARSFSTKNMNNKSIELRNAGLAKGRNTQINKWNEYRESLNTANPLKMPYERICSSNSWTPEMRKKHSEIMKKLWDDDEFRRLATLRNQNISNETRQKLSIARKKAIADGRVVPWGVHSGESYPEKYFAEVLDSYGIIYEKQFKIVKSEYVAGESGSYFLDFFIEINGVKIDLEIDGSHHWLYDGAIERDAQRNSFMKSIGYEVYRIKWCSPTKNRGRDIQQKIDDLLEFLKSFE